MDPEILQKTAEQLRDLSSVIEKTSGEKLDSEHVLNFLKFFGRNNTNGK